MQDYLLPFFDAGHREQAAAMQVWASAQSIDERDDRAACKAWVAALGTAGHLRHCVAAEHGGAREALDSRSLVIAREVLAYHSPLADFAFAMQGLGSGAISLAGTPEQQKNYLPKVAQGRAIAAFALSEPEAGSDVGNMQCSATPTAQGFELNGVKTWISNGGIADFYVVFAKTDLALGTRGITAFIVDADAAGFDASEAIQVMAPHPLAKLRFNAVQLKSAQQLGATNGGFKLAMQTLDIFRASVAGAALGMARRALDEAIRQAKSRTMFKQKLADFQLTQATIGEMRSLLDAAALLTYRAAWLRDVAQTRTTVEAAMAKLSATENAQRIIDMALQLHGGRGVEVGSVVEHLYRDIRALRIYEGASEIQQLIIGKASLGL
jgi:acyl-CoA dehydrogenase